MGKMTYIGDDSTYNLRFIRCIENNPCLWNNKESDYSNRDIVESAWESIAEEMNDIVPNCRERWRNIRTAFNRSLRAKKRKKTYYLSKNLQFLLPHMRHGKDIKSNPVEDDDDDDDDESNEENVDNPCSNSLKTEKNDDTDEEDEISTQQQGFEKIDQFQEKKLISDPLYTKRSLKRKYNEFSSRNTTLPIRWTDSERKKNANEHFLLSLLPFMDEMTGKQNRTFRMRVLKLIDDVLDCNDGQ